MASTESASNRSEPNTIRGEPAWHFKYTLDGKEFDDTVTAAPPTDALEAGAVTDPVGAVLSTRTLVTVAEVAVLPITVAALLTTPWVNRHLAIPSHVDRIVLPGFCLGELNDIAIPEGSSIERGPKDLRDLPEYFGQLSGPPADYGAHDIQIIAEINHAARVPLPELLDLSVNETLSRTIVTSLSLLITLTALLLLGPDVIFGFTAAITLGIFVGTYSSVYMAAPILIWLKVTSSSFVPNESKVDQQERLARGGA